MVCGATYVADNKVLMKMVITSFQLAVKEPFTRKGEFCIN